MKKYRQASFRYFILWGSMLFVLPMGTSLALFSRVLAPEEKFFSNLAASMVVSWTPAYAETASAGKLRRKCAR